MTRFKKLKEKIEKEETDADITFKELTTYLNHYNFRLIRTRGSHHVFKNEFGEELIIPVHGGHVKKIYVRKSAKLIKGVYDEK